MIGKLAVQCMGKLGLQHCLPRYPTTSHATVGGTSRPPALLGGRPPYGDIPLKGNDGAVVAA